MLAWRYAPEPGGAYEMASAYRDGKLAGVAAVRKPRGEPDPRLRGIHMATLSDILFDPNDPDAATAVVAGAEDVARRMGADAMLCSTMHPAIVSVLRRRVFFRLPGNVHLMVRDPKAVANLSVDAHEWWVTRGDAVSDDAF
jgi:hypothetical protein